MIYGISYDEYLGERDTTDRTAYALSRKPIPMDCLTDVVTDKPMNEEEFIILAARWADTNEPLSEDELDYIDYPMHEPPTGIKLATTLQNDIDSLRDTVRSIAALPVVTFMLGVGCAVVVAGLIALPFLTDGGSK